MKSTAYKSILAFNLFTTYVNTWEILECVSTDIYDNIKSRLNYMKSLVDNYPLNGNSNELRIIYTNYENAKEIMKELEGKIDYGLIKLYTYSS